MKFQCPECETVMKLKEDKHICPNADCGHEVTLTEANELFEDGKIIGLVEDNEIDEILETLKEAKKSKKSTKSEEEDEDEDDEDEDMKKEAKKASKKSTKSEEEDEDEDDEDEDMKKESKKKAAKNEEEDEDEEDDDDEDKKDMKKEESFDIDSLDLDMSEDVAAMFNGEELSEAFQSKASTIFEAAVKTKVKEVAKVLEEQKAVAIKKAADTAKTEMEESLNDYLDYAIKEWVENNQVALEAKTRTDMTDKFMEGLAGLFKEHYVEIPADRYDVLEGLAAEVEGLKGQLDEQIKKNVSASKDLNKATAKEIISEVAEGLADTEKEKLEKLAENVDFDEADTFREEIKTLKESYFTKKSVSKDADDDDKGSAGGLTEGNELMSGVLKHLKEKK